MREYTIYTKEKLQEAVDNSQSVMEVIRYLGKTMSGGLHSHLTKKIKGWNIDTSHFTGQGHQRGKKGVGRLHFSKILVNDRHNGRRDKTSILRRALIESGIDLKCVGCGIEDEYNGKTIVLEIDHINENPVDNRRENLRFLCPNCHSQKGSNISKKKSKPLPNGV